MPDRTQNADPPTVGELILDEMFTRDWTRDELARRMGGEFDVTVAVLDFIFAQRSFDDEMVAGLLLGQETAAQLERAFGVSADCWLRIDEAYRAHRAACRREPETVGDPAGPAYQRGEIFDALPGTRLVEMACCGFEFNAIHGPPYECVDCVPGKADYYRAALAAIVEGRAPFSRDELTFCKNAVETFQTIARDALAHTWEPDDA